MHDPMTQAFQIFGLRGLYYRWKRDRVLNKDGKWLDVPWKSPIITVWHCDPERDGSDDSCGWSHVRLSKDDLAWAQKEATKECTDWLSDEYSTINLWHAGNLELLAAAWTWARWRTRDVSRWKPLSHRDLSECVRLLSNAHDNLHATLRAAREERNIERLLICCLRLYRTKYRPWYRHPRWHLWHWKITIEPVRDIKRFLFSRCEKCGQRFRYGYAPVTTQWNNTGPRWFKGERKVFHSKCA